MREQPGLEKKVPPGLEKKGATRAGEKGATRAGEKGTTRAGEKGTTRAGEKGFGHVGKEKLAQAEKMALQWRPEIQEAELKIQQAKQNIKLKRAEYIPELSIAFDFLSSHNYPFIPSSMASIGLLFQWNVFDWGRRRKEVVQKQIELVQANNQMKETRSSVMMDVNNALRGLMEAEALARVNQLAAEASREALRITMNQYKEKEVLLKDVLQAQANLAQANQQEQQALLGVWSSRADLEKALGETWHEK